MENVTALPKENVEQTPNATRLNIASPKAKDWENVSKNWPKANLACMRPTFTACLETANLLD